MTDLYQQKKELRQAMEARRAEFFVRNPDAALALRDHFLKAIEVPPGRIVSGYMARGSEMNPQPLLDALRAQGHRIALPVVGGKGTALVFRLHNPSDKLFPGAMNIPEPAADAAAAEPDILLVPLLAFDLHGNRLGYGGGYYDRTIAALRLRKAIRAVGIAFACQEVTQVPIGPADARLDRIVTEIKAFQA